MGGSLARPQDRSARDSQAGALPRRDVIVPGPLRSGRRLRARPKYPPVFVPLMAALALTAAGTALLPRGASEPPPIPVDAEAARLPDLVAGSARVASVGGTGEPAAGRMPVLAAAGPLPALVRAADIPDTAQPPTSAAHAVGGGEGVETPPEPRADRIAGGGGGSEPEPHSGSSAASDERVPKAAAAEEAGARSGNSINTPDAARPRAAKASPLDPPTAAAGQSPPAFVLPPVLRDAAPSEGGGEATVSFALGAGFVRGTQATLARIGQKLEARPGRNRVTEACRQAVASEAYRDGARQVEVASAGPERRTPGGGLAAAVRVRITYDRFLGSAVREATLTCVLDRAGRIVEARV
ncbi:hypothetical protein DK389_02495 [Methylobacterium durans]|uniref:Uncharacterized protein n=2 Tax=Methylobacterium durans TaxID=2202825 RepID=A0A2U8W0P1_9HYPH|nr:hypothetical protein DK389_02495 [Methylobacterium durans]